MSTSEIPLAVVKDMYKVNASHIAFNEGFGPAQEFMNTRFPELQIQPHLSDEDGLIFRDIQKNETHIGLRGTEVKYNKMYAQGKFGRLGGIRHAVQDLGQDARLFAGVGQRGALMRRTIELGQRAVDAFGHIDSVSGYSLGAARGAHLANAFDIPLVRYFNPYFGTIPVVSKTHLGIAPRTPYNINETYHDIWRTTTDLPSVSHPVISSRVQNVGVNVIEPQPIYVGYDDQTYRPATTPREAARFNPEFQDPYFEGVRADQPIQRFNPQQLRRFGAYGHDPIGLGTSHARHHFLDDPALQGWDQMTAQSTRPGAKPALPPQVSELDVRKGSCSKYSQRRNLY